MKINSILFLSAIFLLIACNDDTPDGTSGDNSNQNANPTVIRNARNLEMPRLDDQTTASSPWMPTDKRSTSPT